MYRPLTPTASPEASEGPSSSRRAPAACTPAFVNTYAQDTSGGATGAHLNHKGCELSSFPFNTVLKGGAKEENISGSHSHRDSFSLRVQLGGSCLSADSRDSVGLSGLARARTGPRAPRRAWETQEGGVKILGKPLASHSSPHPSDPGRLPRDSVLYHFGSKISTSSGNKTSSMAACKRDGPRPA